MSKKNTLLEAAAEILKASQAAGHKDAPKKLDGATWEDLGGPTPTKTQDEKIDYTKPVTKVTPPGKPAPVGQMPPEKITKSLEELQEEKDEKEDKSDKGSDDKEDDKEEEKDEDKEKFDSLKEQIAEDFKKAIAEDVSAILKDEDGLSEEFKKKIATIYEARITDKINKIEEQMLTAYDELFTQEIQSFQEEADAKINDYLDYVVEEWMKDNNVALDSSLKNELTEEFIDGLHKLFAEHYISIPEEKVDVVEELAGKIEELESSLNEEIQRGIELKKQLTESKKSEILQSVCEGLTQTQLEKIRTLAEGVEFTAEGDYSEKVKTIRENFFGKDVKKPSEESAKILTEATETPEPEQQKTSDPVMSMYVQALKKTLPN